MNPHESARFWEKVIKGPVPPHVGYGQVQSATTDTEGSGHKPKPVHSGCYVRIAQQQKLFTA